MSMISALESTLIQFSIMTQWIRSLQAFFLLNQRLLQIFITEYLMATKQ